MENINTLFVSPPLPVFALPQLSLGKHQEYVFRENYNFNVDIYIQKVNIHLWFLWSERGMYRYQFYLNC
jgi:hypothetical protein